MLTYIVFALASECIPGRCEHLTHSFPPALRDAATVGGQGPKAGPTPELVHLLTIGAACPFATLQV